MRPADKAAGVAGQRTRRQPGEADASEGRYSRWGEAMM